MPNLLSEIIDGVFREVMKPGPPPTASQRFWSFVREAGLSILFMACVICFLTGLILWSHTIWLWFAN